MFLLKDSSLIFLEQCLIQTWKTVLVDYPILFSKKKNLLTLGQSDFKYFVNFLNQKIKQENR